ncbi:MAG: histidinol-phosphatase [Chloroflexales bacterium]|nr:histidinol-phosphatase [Chloroflexales bacterium]
MTNREIAAILFNISTILRDQHGNPYRIRAYRQAARALLRIRQPISERVAHNRPLGIPRLGKSLTAKISALAREGRLAFYDEVIATLPADEQRLVRVPGIGPTIAARIHRDLGPTDPDSLRRAAADGRLTRVWGVGPRRQAAILDALAS